MSGIPNISGSSSATSGLGGVFDAESNFFFGDGNSAGGASRDAVTPYAGAPAAAVAATAAPGGISDTMILIGLGILAAIVILKP